MKGIVLAGGRGSRLWPLTRAASKQLLPVYDKPMIYYPLSVLMLAGIRDILIITTPEDSAAFQNLLGDGSDFGVQLSYREQPSPDGIAQAFLIGADHIGDEPVALVLGDNIFHGTGLSGLLAQATKTLDGCVLFGYPVRDPERYGVGQVDETGRLLSIEEKPATPKGNLAITGLYLYTPDVVEIARTLRPSPRGELEITDLNNAYLQLGRAHLLNLGRGFAWLDTGTHTSLMEAGQYVQAVQHRQGIQVSCLEEIGLSKGWLTPEQATELGKALLPSDYGQYIIDIASSATESR